MTHSHTFCWSALGREGQTAAPWETPLPLFCCATSSHFKTMSVGDGVWVWTLELARPIEKPARVSQQLLRDGGVALTLNSARRRSFPPLWTWRSAPVLSRAVSYSSNLASQILSTDTRGKTKQAPETKTTPKHPGIAVSGARDHWTPSSQPNAAGLPNLTMLASLV